jgi:TPR repeat protein
LQKILAQVGASDAASPASTDALTISARLERRINLGEALIGSLGLADGDTLSLDAALTTGRLVVETASGVTDYRGEALSGEGLKALVYEYMPQQRPALGDPADYVIEESFTATRNEQGGQAFNLVLTPDACDLAAGDWLDPEGVGLTRYPNEINPDDAIAACSAAVAAAPGTGRFQYQLGRAYQADTNYQQALGAFEAARDLGHTRAWHALGDLIAEAKSIEEGGAGGPVAQEALELYAKGVEVGDPYAYHALGKQLLRHGRTKASRQHGFDLLSTALELGHTFAMNELGYYFLNENSENFEPERGLRYLKESAARNDIYGYNNLGLYYDKGLGGTKPDPVQALQWYTKAAEGGHPFAPVNIGRMYFNGAFDGKPNLGEAIRWYDVGLDAGIAWGGANAAWIIANKTPKGFSGADAAIRAAKAAVLRDAEAAKSAAQVLTQLDARAIDAASQMILKGFDPSVAVDGVVGPATQAAIADLSARFEIAPPSDNALERLLTLAKVYWRDKGIRIDLL